MKSLITIIVVILAFSKANCQDIFWSQNCLSWKDFRFVNVDSLEKTKGYWGQKAITPYDVKCCEHTIEIPSFKIFAIFEKNRSYTVDTVSVKLLEHEQLHFDIAELYARKIRKAIHELQVQKIEDRNKYYAIINKMLDELDSVEDQYDKETIHGMIVKEQAKWEKNIKQQLEELKNYSVDYSKMKPCDGS